MDQQYVNSTWVSEVALVADDQVIFLTLVRSLRGRFSDENCPALQTSTMAIERLDPRSIGGGDTSSGVSV